MYGNIELDHTFQTFTFRFIQFLGEFLSKISVYALQSKSKSQLVINKKLMRVAFNFLVKHL